MFKHEYRLNSWRDQLKVLAQPILISIITLGVLYGVLQMIPNFTITNIINKAKDVLAPSKYSNISPSQRDELEKQL